MSNLRRPPGPVRQLSLQQPPRRQQVRRQRSAEDEKPLQVFANPIRTRLQCQDGKVELDRPKVRVAWDENPESVSNGVAIIARQIPGKLRPPTAKTKVTTRPVIGEKASILYSRQELAERLRLAWKQREENRANIDIFLAHNAVESNCESRPSSCATSVPSGRRMGPTTRVIINNEPPPPPVPACSTTIRETAVRQEAQEDDLKSSENVVLSPKSTTDAVQLLQKVENLQGTSTAFENDVLLCEDLPHAVEESLGTGVSGNDLPEDEQGGNDEDRDHEGMDSLEKELRAEEEAVRDITLGDWPPCPSLSTKEKKRDQDGDAKESAVLNAKTKRANFSNNSGNSNKVFTNGPIPVPISERREKSSLIFTKDQHSIGLTSVDGKISRRTNSAPPQQRRQQSSVGGSGRTQVSIVIDTPSIGPAPSQEMKSELVPTPEVLLKASISNRAIKSAPIKRRAKSGKRRVGVGGGIAASGGTRGDEGDEDVQNDGKSRRPGGRGRPLLQTKVPDVVTMVSLVSSADSDSDIDQNSPRDDKLIHELRNKLPTTPIIKTSSGCPAIAVLRKPIKSVSFQHESFDCDKDETPKEDRKWGVVGVFGQQRFPVVCRSGGSALPTPEEATSWKSEETAQPLLTTRNEFKEPEDALVTPVTDREKRCLVVPIGDPIRDKKRRLLRTRSTPPRPYAPDERLNSPLSSAPETTVQVSRTRDHDTSNDKITPDELSVLKPDKRNAETEIGSEPEPETGLTSSEPQFQTRKERECWHLYRRMCDKGVYVSFDTVLRGMLTPTEYRLRQKEATPADCTEDK